MHDLLTILSKHTTLTLQGAQQGGEYHGPCPWCGGEDRLVLFDCSSKSRFWCRRCDRRGDLADALEQLDGMPRGKALRLAGIGGSCRHQPSTQQSSSPPSRQAGSVATGMPAKPALLPCKQWQERALYHIQRCEKWLWIPPGRTYREYLHDRGLTDTTIRHHRLGWNRPVDGSRKWLCETPEQWGLGPRTTPNGKRGRVWLWPGITIPHIVDGKAFGVNIRRFKANCPETRTGEKYGRVRGSRECLFGNDDLRADGRPLLLVEGEFDCMLAWQELREMVDVASLLGAGTRVKSPWLERILAYDLVLIAYDADEAGQKGALRLVKPMTEAETRTAVISVPFGNDLGGFHQAGGSLQTWLQYELSTFGFG